jgi:uncharacterized damage-inducible protein DinB
MSMNGGPDVRTIPKPNAGEYPAEARSYIDRVPDDGRLLEHMAENLRATTRLALSLPEERLLRPYAPGKWTIKEVLVHIVDDERIYAYRALRFARGDTTELPGFEQDDYVPLSGANDRLAQDIMAEYAAVRDATIALFRGLPQHALLRSGVANDNLASVRALGYHIAGHEAHHVHIIKERYLGLPG